MINAKDGSVVMYGTHEELLVDCTAILSGIYKNLKNKMGEDFAQKTLVIMGRLAVDPEATEKGIKDFIDLEIPFPVK